MSFAPDSSLPPLPLVAAKDWTDYLTFKKKPAYYVPTPTGQKKKAEGEEKKDHILVIRIGALGDIVLCFQAFHEIRHAFADAEIALLTMPAFTDLAARMPWFDHVMVDPRPSALQIGEWLRLVSSVRKFKPLRVYDLQGKTRQNILYTLLGGPWRGQWSGPAWLNSHPRLHAPSPGMHFTDFVAAQLQLADVLPCGPADVSWFDDPLDGFKLPERFAVLVPGGSPHRQYKRWPARNYADLAKILYAKDITPIAIGTKQDADAIGAVKSLFPKLVDFTDRTNLFQLAGVMRRAVCVVANDSGPMHVAAAVGAPTLGLMSEQVDAAWSAPHGPNAKWLQGKPLSGLDTEKVLLALRDFLDH